RDRQCSQTAVRHDRQQATLLLFRRELNDGLGRVEVRGPDDAGRGAGHSDLAQTLDVGGERHAGAAISFRYEHPVQLETVERGDVVPRELAGRVQRGRARRDFLPCQRADAFEQQPLLLRQVDTCVHTLEDSHSSLASLQLLWGRNAYWFIDWPLSR